MLKQVWAIGKRCTSYTYDKMMNFEYFREIISKGDRHSPKTHVKK